MSTELLSTKDAAPRLGISVHTLYGWLAASQAGSFAIRGQQVVIEHYQGGRRGQGRIMIPAREVDRLLDLMRVTLKPTRARKRPTKKAALARITVPLGRPED